MQTHLQTLCKEDLLIFILTVQKNGVSKVYIYMHRVQIVNIKMCVSSALV